MSPNDRILNVLDPAGSLGSALPGILRGPGNGSVNTGRLNNLLNTHLTNDPAQFTKCGIVYFPFGVYEFDGTITPPAVRGVKFMGGGGMPKSITPILTNQPGAYTVLRYTGSNRSIPLIQMGNHDGWVFEGLTFDGQFMPDSIGTSGTGQQVVFQWDNDVNGFFGEVRNCGFFRAQHLIRARENVGGAAFAEIKFNNCIFCCGDSIPGFVGNWDARAFQIDNNQSVNIGINQCEFNFCPVMVACNGGGRVVMTDITMAICGLILETGIQAQNINGHTIDGVHLDMAHRSMLIYKSTVPNAGGGPVRISNLKFGTRSGAELDLREFVALSSWSGNNLVLSSATSGLWVRVGDRIGFVNNTNRNALLGETTVIAKSSNQYTFTVSDTASAMPFNPADPNIRAIHGEALITCVTGDQVTVSGSTFNVQRMQGRRLARLSQSPVGGQPKLKIIDCDGFQSQDLNLAGMENLIRRTGTCWWKIEDCTTLGSFEEPKTIGNYGISGGGTTPPPSGGTVVGGESEVYVKTKYAATRLIPVVVRSATTGQPMANITFASGDLVISKDGASPIIPVNQFPIQSGSGIYNVFLTATDLQASQVKVLIRDQDTTPVFAAVSIGVDTYGNVLAQHEFDLDTPTVNLPDGGLTAVKIAANAITDTKIASGALTKAKFAAEPVTAGASNASNRSLPDLMAELWANVVQPKVVGTNFQARNPSGGTVALYALNDSINPTEKIRTS